MGKLRNPATVIVWTAIAAGACASTGRPAPVPAARTASWCREPGRGVDSAFAVERARDALAPQPPFILAPHSMDRVPEGLLVRMVVAEPVGTRGGGGLVWVDAETGCAVVLIRYE